MTWEIFDRDQKSKATRLSFGEELARLGALHPRIVALDADLSKSTQTQIFAEKFPQRFFNMGIAEANMIGTAAGLALSGQIPFAASFGCFLTGRFDQIRMSVAFTGAPVRLVGTHAGVAIGEDGHSQMALEDIALMRTLPNMTVFQPVDDHETRAFMEWSLTHPGPCYLRLTRQNVTPLKWAPEKKLTPGLWNHWGELSEGGVAVLATGGVFEAAAQAAQKLASGGQKVSLVNCSWLKPFDESYLMKLGASRPALVVTVEDHFITGGLGSLVAEFSADRRLNLPLTRLAVTTFGQSGSPQANLEHYGFTAERIFQSVQEALKR